MTQDDVNKLVAMYLIAIGRTGAPNSHVWMAIDQNMSDLNRHQVTLGQLKQVGLVTEKFNYLRLTPAGESLLAKVERSWMSRRKKETRNYMKAKLNPAKSLKIIASNLVIPLGRIEALSKDSFVVEEVPNSHGKIYRTVCKDRSISGWFIPVEDLEILSDPE